MRMDPNWFSRAKMFVIEATALISLSLIALALILNEIKHLF
jgi:hypothetical protein